MKQKEFKAKMPACAAFIESLCEAFGRDMIHGQIRKGLAGEPVFHAIENGHEIGTRPPRYVRIGNHPVTGIAVDLDALEQAEQGGQA